LNAPNDSTPLAAPLAALGGATPECPRWFRDALALQPARSWHDVQGARIETLAWGERGRPGLLLLHGKMAHAQWWNFIAPFFAGAHRVVALSFGGMGGSDWRPSYSVATMADEAMVVGEHEGLFDSAVPPLIVGHSFGGFVSLLCAQQHGSTARGSAACSRSTCR
jgi:pimeloyl-ACP methyl ester carboxylesterase